MPLQAASSSCQASSSSLCCIHFRPPRGPSDPMSGSNLEAKNELNSFLQKTLGESPRTDGASRGFGRTPSPQLRRRRGGWGGSVGSVVWGNRAQKGEPWGTSAFQGSPECRGRTNLQGLSKSASSRDRWAWSLRTKGLLGPAFGAMNRQERDTLRKHVPKESRRGRMVNGGRRSMKSEEQVGGKLYFYDSRHSMGLPYMPISWGGLRGVGIYGSPMECLGDSRECTCS